MLSCGLYGLGFHFLIKMIYCLIFLLYKIIQNIIFFLDNRKSSFEVAVEAFDPKSHDRPFVVIDASRSKWKWVSPKIPNSMCHIGPAFVTIYCVHSPHGSIHFILKNLVSSKTILWRNSTFAAIDRTFLLSFKMLSTSKDLQYTPPGP